MSTQIKQQFPLFSVITITLNNIEGLKKTEKSINKQSFKDAEWIVIDGESSDGTTEHLRKRRSERRREDYPFQFISEKDDGLYDAMNKGIEAARGHYMIFLNAGDEFAASDTLEIIAPHTKKKPDFIYGDALEPQAKTDQKIYKTARRYKELAWGMITHHQSMLYRRHTVRDFKIHYSLLYDIAADYDFTARFLLKAKKIVYIPKPICIFEQGGISQKNASLGRKEQYMIREKLEMVSPQENIWIITLQTATWYFKTFCPWGYHALKSMLKRR